MNMQTRAIARPGLRTAITATLFGAAVAGAIVAAPAGSAPAFAEGAVGELCAVTGGTMTWGVKESFRSYISSSIANGEWTASDGASYETPEFTFSDAEGQIDPATGAGTVSFDGTVQFTGHEGVLNLTLEDPTIEFAGDGTARLLLDTKSNDAQGTLTIDEDQAIVAKISGLPGLEAGEVTAYEAAAAPAILTAQGATAFSGFYATGDPLDPVTLAIELAPCAVAAGTAEPAAPEATETPAATPEAPAASAEVPWIPIAIGGVALVVIAVAATLLLTGRRTRGSEAAAEASTPPTAE